MRLRWMDNLGRLPPNTWKSALLPSSCRRQEEKCSWLKADFLPSGFQTSSLVNQLYCTNEINSWVDFAVTGSVTFFINHLCGSTCHSNNASLWHLKWFEKGEEINTCWVQAHTLTETEFKGHLIMKKASEWGELRVFIYLCINAGIFLRVKRNSFVKAKDEQG